MKAITVENLSKVYSVATANNEGMSFREMLIDQARSLFKKSQQKEQFYALKDVSFEVEQGEVLGIIGKNGSGKSTLLKVLSKITAPTSGRAIVRGRVASLLEVGTGFHAELTGRENIFMSGIILGMKRWEINKYFDEIVSFAGVEQFLDMPVKKYSSGMRLRLAFSVAAHLQPEILLVDEVLAVGDYEFEKKCLKVMNGISNAGRTILFVSHNMDTLKRLCNRAILLKNGQVAHVGNTQNIVDDYLGLFQDNQPGFSWSNKEHLSSDFVDIDEISILSFKNNGERYVYNNDSVVVQTTYTIKLPNARISLFLMFYNKKNELLFTACEALSDTIKADIRATGKYVSICIVPPFIFKEEIIYVSFRFGNAGVAGRVLESNFLIGADRILQFQVKEHSKHFYEGFIWNDTEGLIKPALKWDVRNVL